MRATDVVTRNVILARAALTPKVLHAKLTGESAIRQAARDLYGN